jgi:protein-S-isoprenylcysteine O-methyltransferase Ste14
MRPVRRLWALSAVFFLLGPGLEAGVGPWLLTGFEVGEEWPGAVRVLGIVMVVAGLAVVVGAFVRFAAEGAGTPAPVAPPGRLVVGGAYRHVRHPMYVATAAVIVGEGLALGQPILFAAATAYGAALGALAHFYEEPAMRRRFGDSYDAYRREVPGWVPRLRPWAP